jgi:phosphoglycolate phosphatase
LLGTADEDVIAAAIRAFRQRYTTVGFRENRLYDGIVDALTELRAEGATLSIATSKREDIARQVVRFLGIEACFAQVRGCGLGGTKAELLSDLLAGAAPTDRAVMVGDRDSDFVAASAVGIPALGVRWGYGSGIELTLATHIVEVPADLPAAAGTYARPRAPRGGAQ